LSLSEKAHMGSALRTFQWLTFLLCLGASRQSVAEDPEALIRQGNALRKSGDDAKAHGYFKRAYEIARTPRTSAQLGLVELALGQWTSAAKHLDEALESGQDPWIRKNRGVLEQSFAQVQPRVATFSVEGSPHGAQVRLDGEVVGSLPLSKLFLEPKKVTVEVTADGYKPDRQTVNLSPGTTRAVQVELQLAPAPTTTETSPSLPSGPAPLPSTEGELREDSPVSPGPSTPPAAWQRPLAWTAAGMAVVLTGVGAYSLHRSNAQFTAFNDHMPPMTSTNREGKCREGIPDSGGGDCGDLLRGGKRARTIAVTSFVGAGVAAAASVLLFTLAPDQHSEQAYALGCQLGLSSVTSLEAGCVWRF
jgi:hypothetical protein